MSNLWKGIHAIKESKSTCTIHKKSNMFSCFQCDYFSSRKYDLKHHTKRHTPLTPNLPPKIPRHEPIPNIIEPPANDHLLEQLENHEIKTSLEQNSQVSFGITQMMSPDAMLSDEIQHFFRDE